MQLDEWKTLPSKMVIPATPSTTGIPHIPATTLRRPPATGSPHRPRLHRPIRPRRETSAEIKSRQPRHPRPARRAQNDMGFSKSDRQESVGLTLT
jgi:hypothetical protein